MAEEKVWSSVSQQFPDEGEARFLYVSTVGIF